MNTTTATALPVGTWQLDVDTTSVTVSVKKLGFLNVAGDLTVSSGSIEINDQHQVTSVSVVADATSYNSGNEKRDEHVATADFLEVDQYPEIAFSADTVTAGANGFAAKGSVTVKGQRSPIDVAISDVTFDDTTGSFTATATVDRRAIGVDKMPNFVIGKDLALVVKANVSRR